MVAKNNNTRCPSKIESKIILKQTFMRGTKKDSSLDGFSFNAYIMMQNNAQISWLLPHKSSYPTLTSKMNEMVLN